MKMKFTKIIILIFSWVVMVLTTTKLNFPRYKQLKIGPIRVKCRLTHSYKPSSSYSHSRGLSAQSRGTSRGEEYLEKESSSNTEKFVKYAYKSGHSDGYIDGYLDGRKKELKRNRYTKSSIHGDRDDNRHSEEKDKEIVDTLRSERDPDLRQPKITPDPRRPKRDPDPKQPKRDPDPRRPVRNPTPQRPKRDPDPRRPERDPNPRRPQRDSDPRRPERDPTPQRLKRDPDPRRPERDPNPRRPQRDPNRPTRRPGRVPDPRLPEGQQVIGEIYKEAFKQAIELVRQETKRGEYHRITTSQRNRGAQSVSKDGDNSGTSLQSGRGSRYSGQRELSHTGKRRPGVREGHRFGEDGHIEVKHVYAADHAPGEMEYYINVNPQIEVRETAQISTGNGAKSKDA